MSINVYIMPSTGAGTSSDPRRGKYWDQLVGLDRVEMDYGLEPVFLVAAKDVPPSVDSSITANADVTVVPDLSTTVAGRLAATQTALESLNIPSGWITSAMTFGTVVRVVMEIGRAHV